MKKLILITLLILMISFFCGCSLLYDYEIYAAGSFDVGYSKSLKNAYLGLYRWDGTDDGMCIMVPEYYNNIQIKGLGGYYGRGVPTSFGIAPTEEAKNMLCPNATQWAYATHTPHIVANSVQYLRFTVNISKYIQEIENVSVGGIIVAEYADKDETKYNIYILTCYVTCDEDNKTFYAKDGKLYFRKNNALVEGFIYDDFDLEQHNETYKDKTPWLYPF